ncbi:MAG: DegT/DnrJ/EryC1/StrS family aminotransferase [Vampirovibrionales bacterium]|nr:DegT/DnrJ/EryC1/StrS family aminotransferase [Vampirovibrionales bacterium]
MMTTQLQPPQTLTDGATPEFSQGPIPMLDLKRQYALLKPALDDAMLSVLGSGQYILGPQVQAFEQEAAAFCQTRHAIGVASGTDALYLALRALNIGPGDEVITTAFSYIATSEAIAQTGAIPVFADIEPLTPASSFNLNLEALEALITPRTRAILPVHLFGLPVPMVPLMALAKKHQLAVIEDCAQAMGATCLNQDGTPQPVGSFGDFGCFSFFPTKNLGAAGDGGLVTTQQDALNDQLRMLRAHGSKQRYYHEVAGLNSRLDELQAALLRIKLPYLSQWNLRRRAIAAQYSQAVSGLQDLVTPIETPDTNHVYHQYTILLHENKREQVQAALAANQIASMIYYPVPLHLQGTHKPLGYQSGDLPQIEAAASRVLSLPIFPELTEAEILRIATTIKHALS